MIGVKKKMHLLIIKVKETKLEPFFFIPILVTFICRLQKDLVTAK